MKVRVFCQTGIKGTVVDMLRSGGFEVSEDGDFDLVEHNYFHALLCLDNDKNQHYIESYIPSSKYKAKA